MKKNLIVLTILFLTIFILNSYAQGLGKIKGIAKDSISGEPLIGANIFIKGTSIGTAANLKGEFLIKSVPTGEHILVASYIGYTAKAIPITITKNRTLVYNFELNYTIIEGEELVITAQAEGQMNAINRQLSSQSIKNVISAKQIQEIPDANAAEAIGRMSGVSLIRNGGEGNKVVIRGLSPEFSKIQVEGVSMVATGDGEHGGARSSDLSMISPYMLEGIEVTKAAMPDQEADVIGGTVNFILRQAPKEFHFDVLAQSSFNNLKSEFGDYKFVLNGSNRFFDNKFGVFAQVDIEKRNRSSYELKVDYQNHQEPEDHSLVDVSIKSLNLKDITRTLNRYGGTLVLDYKLPNGIIKYNNFISGINKDNINRLETHMPDAKNHVYSLKDLGSDLLVMTNSLKIDYNLWDIQVDAGVSYAYSENQSPNQIEINGREVSAYEATVDIEGNPIDVPNHAKNNDANTRLMAIELISRYSQESELGANVNFNYEFNIDKSINVSVKTGYKYKTKEKEYDKNVGRAEFMHNPANYNNMATEFPWMQEIAPLGSDFVPYSLFNDPDYKPSNFLNGDYDISNMPSLDLLRDVSKILHKSVDYLPHYPKTVKNDYHGNEDYNAAYIMSEIKLGQSVTFIPGVRYEKNTTNYTGRRGVEGVWFDRYLKKDTTITRSNEFWLPMIHLKYKPFDWFDVRLAYTETLSRPNYDHIIPSWNIQDTYINWNNPFLKPAHSTNYDIYASIYNNEIGLVSVGAFKKEIKDMIFWGGTRVVFNADSLYGLPTTQNGNRLGSMVNNKFPVELYGFEVEWKTHFWYLPGILKGLVFNINYTFIHSEAKYPKTTIKREFLDEAPWEVRANIDTFFVDRLINQPNNILNITLGYDYKGFSTRISMLYQDNIFKRSNFYEKHRGYSTEFMKWDISVRQKLPLEGLEFIGNFSNVGSAIEKDILNGKYKNSDGTVGGNYPLKEQHYGMTIDAGLRYRF